MLVEGKYCSLETEDEIKSQAVVNYMDFVMSQHKEAIVKEAVEAYVENREVKVDFLDV